MDNKHIENVEYKEYLDLEHKYFIIVPLNLEAENLIADGKFMNPDGVTVKDCFEYMCFDEKAYLLMESYLFNFIDSECDLIITMYEEEWADGEKLNQILEITNRMLSNSDNKEFLVLAEEFKHLVNKAMSLNTSIVFFF